MSLRALARFDVCNLIIQSGRRGVNFYLKEVVRSSFDVVFRSCPKADDLRLFLYSATWRLKDKMNNDFEYDFLAVGDGEKSGDAIAFRFGNLSGPRSQQYVVVVDAGTKESAEKLVQLITKTYGTTLVNLVISTHPDGDHASGLTVILEKLTVDLLWMHRPWSHSSDISHLFVGGKITDTSIDRTIRESLEHANELEQIAKRKGIPITEPFAGEVIEWASLNISLRVLGPSLKYYQSLLPSFRDCPKVHAAASVGSYLSRGYAAVMEAVTKVFESWGVETLTDPTEDTSSENNSSVILLVDVAGEKMLLTGDAGAPALTHAADFAAANGIDLTTVKRIQIPHHGSRRNVGPTVLNRILGPKIPSNDTRVDQKIAIVSVAAKGAPKHPAKKVLNAFKRRGAKCYETAGTDFWTHSSGAPQRGNYSSVNPLPFYSEVEE